jgi:hypothetical protein
MRISSFLLCILSASLVSGITVSAYNELNRVNFTESDGLDTHSHHEHHGHGHHGHIPHHNDTEVHHAHMKPAIVETRKLLEVDDEDTFEDYADDFSDDIEYHHEDESAGRRLLRSARAPKAAAPAPKAAAPALKAAAPAPKAAAPAPKAAAQAPKAAAQAPKAAAPAPKDKDKKRNDELVRRHARTPAVVVSVTKPTVVVASVTAAAVTVAANTATKTLTKEETLLKNWLATTEGLSATEFCKSLGIEKKFDIYNGCLFDMYTTKDKQIAKESAVAAEEFSTKGRTAVGKRFCVASGDPHCTNYDGEFFHIQEPGMYTITRSFNGVFEVQEQMRKNGASTPGVPSCMIGAVIRYKKTRIEIDVAKNNKIIVNGIDKCSFFNNQMG